jgi:hypothetical protein
MNQKPQPSPEPSDAQPAQPAQPARQHRLAALALPLGALFLALAVLGLGGGETSSTSYAFFPIGAALLLMSTQRWWTRPAAAQDRSR